MARERTRGDVGDARADPRRRRSARSLAAFAALVLATTQIRVASAHEVTATGGLARWHGTLLVLAGVALAGAAIAGKRTNRLSPTTALYGVFVGIAVTAVGAIVFDALSPDPAYTASSMPFPRSWYRPLALAVGLLTTMSSFVVGWWRWPTRPRYTFLGMLMGAWISYPYLVAGAASHTHPIGYALVVGTPVLAGYIVWKDAGGVLGAVLRDPVARRFGVGVGVVLALFFVSMTGYLSVFPEAGAPHEVTVVVLPVVYQLVTWPTLEVVLPHVPLFLAVSPGQLALVGSLSALVGLNAAVIARRWRLDERAGTTEGTAGTAAVVGSCACGCCGPLVAKVAVLAAGPSIAAPLYWVFVDTASPLTALFVIGSIVLFTGSLLYSIESAGQDVRSTAVVPTE